MTLAFTLINPALLYAGAALASIPIIIHLLNRRRFKRMVWAAMEFLIAAHKKNAKRLRIENLILLLLRTLIILMLALALARPVLDGFLAQLGRSSTHRILIIDDTFSMGARQGPDGDPVMKQARDAALWLMSGFSPNDGISVITVGSRPHTLIAGPSRNHEDVIEKIEALQLSDAAGSKAAALKEARKIIDESELERKLVYILTDNTRVSWTSETGENLGPAVAALSEDAGVMVVDFGRPGRSNLAISRLEPLGSVVARGVSSDMAISVFNPSDKPIEDVVVEMKVNGEPAGSVIFNDIPPGKSVDRTWAHVFQDQGNHVVEAHIRPLADDALLSDSSRYLALEVKEVVNVLLVNGEPRNVSAQDEVFYLQHAIDPRGSDRQRITSYLPRVVTDTQLSEDMISVEQDIIVLANVASVDEQIVRRLENFVRDGGSLVVYLGGQVRAGDYNRQLYNGGKGLLPAALGDLLGSTEPGQESQHAVVNAQYLTHPAMSVFKPVEGAGLETLRAFQYFDLKLPHNVEGIEPILTFTDGRPLAVEKRFGRGRVILWSTSADLQWNNLLYMPRGIQVLHQVLQHLIPDTRWRFNRLVNAETNIPVSASQIALNFVLEKPDGGHVDLRPEAIGDDRHGLVIQDLTGRGSYKLTLSGTVKQQIAVNVDTRESDLSHLSKQDLVGTFGGAPVVVAAGLEGLKAEIAQQQAAGGWARNLLYITLALVLLETFLAWYFNRNV